MQNKLLSIAILFLLFAGCRQETPEELRKRADKMEAEARKIENGEQSFSNITINGHISHFTYLKHKYIRFTEGYGDYATTGVVHDPDCPCHNSKNITNGQ